ncbi:AAA family ATPase [Candidatus Poribacteria bacterium]|nr:AAA family ATPase [Candidatus Poribacteria bacterium]MYA56266.1 AAA family ATPase [Candidatus Poribacteria bacterium]
MRLTSSQQDALNIEKHICVTAGAGSGKTTVLVERYLKILREGNADPQEIVAITFTDKAAAEMKERIIEELSLHEERERSERDNPLQGLREKMSTAHISTIHAFCSRILREFPFQAEVPANFSILQGIDQKLLLQETVKQTLRDIATDEEDKHRDAFTRLLQRYGGQQKLVDLLSTMINQRDVLEHLMQEIYRHPNDTEIRGALQKRVRERQQEIQERLMSTIDIPEFIRCLNTVLQIASGKNAAAVKDLTQHLETLHGQNLDPSDALNLLTDTAYLITTARNDIAKRDFLGSRVTTTGIEAEINFLVSTAKKIKAAPPIKDNKNTADEVETDDDFLLSTIHDLLKLYTRISKAYRTAKLSQGKLDFTDLQLKTRDLVRDNAEIRQKLVSRHKYYMVDEYQDTNELQYELVMLLTNELTAANLFIVGDPKQSIYAFRGADVRVFTKTKEKIVDNGGDDIRLTENFRSLRDTVGFVNYFFNHLMGDGKETEFEVEYEALTQARPVNTNGSVEILLGKQDEGLADEYSLIAHHIKSMKANAETIYKRGASEEGRGQEAEHPIEYGDIAILIRSRRHLPDIENALLEADIPYLTTGGVGFYQRQEIYDIWNYLNFLNDPKENETSLAAVLRGPAFGISDTELYEISLQKGENFWEQAQNYQDRSHNLRTAIATLKKHKQFAHRMPVNQLIVTIVNETGMIGTLKTGKQGQQRWVNYQKLLEHARNFDGDETKQILPDFIEFLDILIEEERREGQAPVEASSGAVEIMTIHASKGKQFPVVILPRLDRQGQTDREPFIDEAFGIGFSPLNPDKDYNKTEPDIVTHMKNRTNEKEIAEKKRLFYVGTTRACDRLILSGTLSDSGKPQQILEWLYKYLDIDEEDRLLELPVSLEVFTANSKNTESFQLQIPIHQGVTETESIDEISDETTPVDFPELPRKPELTGTSAAFSVSELANYARCPLRYQLQNVLQIPTNGQETPDVDEDEINAALRSTLARIRQQSDIEELDTTIDKVLENYPEVTTESKIGNQSSLLQHVNNFINSELGETAFSASTVQVNQHIHADINGHIVDGTFDRLFKDETGNYQIINFKTDAAQNLDTPDPEMELYSLLLHRCYPNQSTVTINIFFTEQGQSEQRHFSPAQLQELQEQWEKRILALQGGVYEKNLEHCCFCPYAASDGQCIITEA